MLRSIFPSEDKESMSSSVLYSKHLNLHCLVMCQTHHSLEHLGYFKTFGQLCSTLHKTQMTVSEK